MKSTFLSLCMALTLATNAWAEATCPSLQDGAAAGLRRVGGYRAIFRACRTNAGVTRLATRSMDIDGLPALLTVDPQTLATRLEPAACWTCAETTDAAQRDTRLLRAIVAASGEPTQPVSRNAGLAHGAGDGVYLTGDLCPSARPLDRGFIELIVRQGPHTPLALAISGGWLARHGEDFAWLRDKARAGALDIVWINHSHRHPYVRGLAETKNYLMRPGVDLDAEIFATERLLIAHGATPSVFFRFPGLVADAALLEKLRARHLVALGADAWLVLSPPPRPGSIVLVHPNGNEPEGLRLFARLLDKGKLPRPFRRIEDAP